MQANWNALHLCECTQSTWQSKIMWIDLQKIKDFLIEIAGMFLVCFHSYLFPFGIIQHLRSHIISRATSLALWSKVENGRTCPRKCCHLQTWFWCNQATHQKCCPTLQCKASMAARCSPCSARFLQGFKAINSDWIDRCLCQPLQHCLNTTYFMLSSIFLLAFVNSSHFNFREM